MKNVANLGSGDKVVLKKGNERAIINHKIDMVTYSVRTRSGNRIVNLFGIQSTSWS